MDLDYLREEALDAEDSDDGTIGQDEGGEVGSAGKANDGVSGPKKKERKRKVKVGRQLGVGELVEKAGLAQLDLIGYDPYIESEMTMYIPERTFGGPNSIKLRYESCCISPAHGPTACDIHDLGS